MEPENVLTLIYIFSFYYFIFAVDVVHCYLFYVSLVCINIY